MVELNTFSIAAYDPGSGDFGVAASTARPVVGALVPFVSLKGAIATQARVNTDLGHQGLGMLALNVPIDIALQLLLEADDERDRRQLHGVTDSRSFAFTGEKCVAWAGHHNGKHFTVAGNMLAGPQVVEAMVEAYERAAAERVELSERLVHTLEAGQAAGGDKRGKQSAALLIASPEPRMYHNLRVDDHTDPVAELRRLHDLVVVASHKIEQEYGLAGLRLFSRVKW